LCEKKGFSRYLERREWDGNEYAEKKARINRWGRTFQDGRKIKDWKEDRQSLTDAP